LKSFNATHKKSKYKYASLDIDNLNNKVEIVCSIHGKILNREQQTIKKGRGYIKCGHNVKANKNRKLPKDLVF